MVYIVDAEKLFEDSFIDKTDKVKITVKCNEDTKFSTEEVRRMMASKALFEFSDFPSESPFALAIKLVDISNKTNDDVAFITDDEEILATDDVQAGKKMIRFYSSLKDAANMAKKKKSASKRKTKEAEAAPAKKKKEDNNKKDEEIHPIEKQVEKPTEKKMDMPEIKAQEEPVKQEPAIAMNPPIKEKEPSEYKKSEVKHETAKTDKPKTAGESGFKDTLREIDKAMEPAWKYIAEAVRDSKNVDDVKNNIIFYMEPRFVDLFTPLIEKNFDKLKSLVEHVKRNPVEVFRG